MQAITVKKLVGFGLLVGHSMAMAFVTVGNTPDCDYDNIFPAYQDSDIEMRVTNEQVHSNNFTIEKIKVIKGGYDSCQDAENNVMGSQKTRWSGLNGNNNTVIEVDADLTIVSTVIIENFDIYAGNNTSFASAGGIKVTGNSNLILRNSVVRDNQGNEGGGIHVFGDEARLALENTEVRDNSVTGYGGGIYCSNDAYVSIDAQSTIHHNQANFNGGGIFAGMGCAVHSDSGAEVAGRDDEGISNNQAQRGGGVYLQTGAQLVAQGNTDNPARIIGNFATTFNELAGGGLYLAGANTTAMLSNTHLQFNSADGDGGGFVVTDQATLTMGRSGQGCQYSNQDLCSELSRNETLSFTATGATGHISAGGSVDISQTLVANNLSINTAGVVLDNGAYLRLEGNLISNNDGLGAQSAAPHLFYLDGDNNQASQLDFGFNTVVNNNVDNFFTTNNSNSSQLINVFNSIIWDFGTIFNFNGPATAQIDCATVHESASLSGNVGAVLTNDPLFINPAMGDYRPSLASDAIDFCDNDLFTDQHPGLNGNPRGHDMSSVNNAFGTYDAGAYEYYPEIIFRSGFD
ncbi:hypothetical protein OS175_13355 [Marinicella sp. S1101]|uniref:hypothetical protein n=1 Tax=Marinicella marina TaxID=2996016 RepID=UPI002260C28D|nr:hypothetical protein [Marinicella marina]MCX7554861.1 hypothetical protein [Marinicella marina]MDJ1141519.1 hypothetical protein [Marinicella marina]